jgi:glycosyltransferase involved in cell wall biosynthesis
MLVILTNIPTPYRTAFFDALAEEMARVGRRVHVLYCAKTEPRRHWPYEPAKMKHAHTVLRGFHPAVAGLHAHLNPGVLAELNLLKPDTMIIAGSWNTPTMLIAGLNIYSPAPRRFFWSEGHAGAVMHQSGLIAWIRRRIYRTFDGFAVPNSKSAEWAIAQAGGRRQVVTLPNAIDVKYFARPSETAKQEARRKLTLEDSDRVLVQVSALTARKGVLALAEKFLALPVSERSGGKLLFVGEGDQRPKLEGLAAASDGAIRVLGQLAPESVRQVLWAADGFVLNTFFDRNPISVIEAAAARLPILLSAAAGNIREAVEIPRTGYVIQDATDPTDALVAFLRAPAAQLAEMGERAAGLARDQFDAPAVARSLVGQLYPRT